MERESVMKILTNYSNLISLRKVEVLVWDSLFVKALWNKVMVTYHMNAQIWEELVS